MGTFGEIAEECVWILVASTESAKLVWIDAILKAANWKEKKQGAYYYKFNYNAEKLQLTPFIFPVTRCQLPIIVLQEPEEDESTKDNTLDRNLNTSAPLPLTKANSHNLTASSQDQVILESVDTLKFQTDSTSANTRNHSKKNSVNSLSSGIEITLFPFKPPTIIELDSQEALESVSAHHDRFFKPKPLKKRRDIQGFSSSSAKASMKRSEASGFSPSRQLPLGINGNVYNMGQIRPRSTSLSQTMPLRQEKRSRQSSVPNMMNRECSSTSLAPGVYQPRIFTSDCNVSFSSPSSTTRQRSKGRRSSNKPGNGASLPQTYSDGRRRGSVDGANQSGEKRLVRRTTIT
jgi:hypothetical protein